MLLVLVGFSALLSASEIALTSMDKIRLGVLIRKFPRKAKALQVLMDDPNSLLITIAVANNFSNILGSSIATILSIQLLSNLGNAEAGLVATAFMTVYLLIFGEITPKHLGKNNPERLTLGVIALIVGMQRLLRPINVFFKATSNALLRVMPKELRETEGISVSEDQITMLLEVGEQRGLIDEEEVDMIRRIFAFDDLVARQIMVARTEVVLLDVNTTWEVIRQVVREEEHSRYPIFEEEPDNVIGILHVKDLLNCEPEGVDLRALMRPAHFIPESKPINDLLRDFQQLKQQMAIIVDEYGGMSGIITIEDILEEIVGEIHDEYDTPEDEITDLGGGVYLVEGGTEIDRLNESLSIHLPTEEGTTISGLILNRLEEIPKVGETLTVDGAHLYVEDASEKEIHTIRLKIIARLPAEPEPGA